MSTIQPKPENRQELRGRVLECLAALKSDLERLSDCPDANATIAELREVVREIEAQLSFLKE
jgi:hypothetical protein